LDITITYDPWLKVRLILLQDMLLEHFSDIPNNGLPGDDFSNFNHLNAFQDSFTDKIFVVQAVGNVTKLDVTFSLESIVREYKTKPHDYISFLLGHEGKGSLASYLRKKCVHQNPS